MEANTENPASPHWRTLYNAAILELDCNRLPQRIAEAQRVITKQITALSQLDDPEPSEVEALMNALNVLRDLQKMADRNRHSR